jgi:hypothetical protein
MLQNETELDSVSGEPDCVRAPVAGSMVNVDSVESLLFPTKRDFPVESTVGAMGLRPAEKGEPETGVNAPDEAIVNAITSVESPMKELAMPT